MVLKPLNDVVTFKQRLAVNYQARHLDLSRQLPQRLCGFCIFADFVKLNLLFNFEFADFGAHFCRVRAFPAMV
jgi:hypothetical protein